MSRGFRLAKCFLPAAGLALLVVSCSSKQSSTGEERLRWNTTTLVDDYERVGSKDPKWDAIVRPALADFANLRAGSDFESETRLYLIGNAAKDAVKAGCNDPLVRYLYCRYGMGNSTKSLNEKQDEFLATARTMGQSAYSPLRKFYCNLEAADLLWQQRSRARWAAVVDFRTAAIDNLTAALHEKTFPVEEAYHAAHALFKTLENNAQDLTNAYYSIEQPLFKNWPKVATSYVIKGEFFLEYAWRGRGHAAASDVTEQQWKMFFDRLQEAETALTTAWSLNPKDPLIPTLMIGVVEGQQKKRRPDMELWFERAMQLNPTNYTACQRKLHYLSPQWNGSGEDMLAFGRECVASTNWGGKVPLILVDAHSDIYRLLRGVENRSSYWNLPNVWPDIKAAYDKYARLNPAETRFRYPLSWYAFRCEQWQEFTEQIQILQSNTTDFYYGYFGGEEDFQKALALAREQVRKN